MPSISDSAPIQPQKPEISQSSESVKSAGVNYEGHTVQPQQKEEPKIPTPPPLPSSSKPALDKNKLTKSTPQDSAKKAKQDKAIDRLKSAALSAPKTATPLERELIHGRDTIQLKQISKQIKTAAQSAGKQLGLQPLGKGSQNPVSKIGGPEYIPRAALENQLKTSQIDYYSAGSDMMTSFRQLESPYFKEKLKALVIDYQKVDPKDNNAVQNALSKIVDALKSLENEFTNEDVFFRDRIRFPATSSQLNDLVTKLDDQIHPPTLENSTTYVKKDDALNELRLGMNAAPEEMKSTWLEAIDAVKQAEGNYIDKSILDGKGLPTLNVPSFVSASQFVAQNDSKTTAINLVQNTIRTTGLSGSEYVFKTGAENTRELLGGKLLGSLGLGKALVPKTDVSLTGTKLGSQENPEGIASEFVSGSTIFPIAEWKELMQTKKMAAIASFKLPELQKEAAALSLENSPESRAKLAEVKIEIFELSESLADYEKSKETVMGLGGTKSITDHALSDALLCSYDSHIMQYLMKDGDVVNIDFARFMAPNEAFTRGEGDNKGVFLTLRSVWLDHPVTEQPLSSEHVNTIMNWDMEQIESQWRRDGLIGDSAFFDKATATIEDLRVDRRNLGSASEDELNVLCDKYGLEKGSEMEMKKGIASHLKNQFESIQQECFGKIHPKAFEEYKNRTLALQSYIRECQAEQKSPNLAEAIPRMYPRLAVFMKVVERIDENPGVSISFTSSSGSLQQRSLSSIISEAENKKMASADEIAQMKESLAYYLANVPDESTISTAMDL